MLMQIAPHADPFSGRRVEVGGDALVHVFIHIWPLRADGERRDGEDTHQPCDSFHIDSLGRSACSKANRPNAVEISFSWRAPMILALLVLISLGAAQQPPAATPQLDPKLIRVHVQTDDGGDPIELEARRDSVKHLSVAIAGKKKVMAA